MGNILAFGNPRRPFHGLGCPVQENGHMGPPQGQGDVGWEARRKGLALIVDRIDSINPEGYPMVLTGDFNMHPDRPEFAELNKRMISVREVAEKTDHLGTFNGWGKKEEGDFDTIIDYIYVKGFSAYPLYETVRKPYMDRKFISDHYPIKAVLKF